MMEEITHFASYIQIEWKWQDTEKTNQNTVIPFIILFWYNGEKELFFWIIEASQ